MIKIQLFKAIIILILPGLVTAHGPTRQKVSESVTITADAVKAWSLVSDLRSVGKWHSFYKSIKKKGDELQPVTMFTGTNGVIQILALDPEKKLFKYRLKKSGDIPVNNYSGRLFIEEVGSGKINVTYKGAFYRKYMNNNPPPGEDDEAAIEAVTKMYRDTLKKIETRIKSK